MGVIKWDLFQRGRRPKNLRITCLKNLKSHSFLHTLFNQIDGFALYQVIFRDIFYGKKLFTISNNELVQNRWK